MPSLRVSETKSPLPSPPPKVPSCWAKWQLCLYLHGLQYGPSLSLTFFDSRIFNFSGVLRYVFPDDPVFMSTTERISNFRSLILSLNNYNLSATSWSLIQSRPTDVVRRCVWSINLKNEEALAHWGLLRQIKNKIIVGDLYKLRIVWSYQSVTLQPCM